MKDRLFWTAKDEEIKRAETTDLYFIYAEQVMRSKGVNPRVVIEVYTRGLPYEGDWGVVSGIYEVARLLEGLPVNVRAMEEGEVFLVSKGSILNEPVHQLEGRYLDVIRYETPVLGLLCMSSGISTKAARIRMLAGGRSLLSFGTRRVHPCLAPMVERAAYIGGFDGVSNVLGAKLMGKEPVGTMPHSLIQCFGDQERAWKAFDEVLPKSVPRIALVDTYYDEKTESVRAYEALGDSLYGVRLDTPGSRRGDLRKIVEEVRWELGIRGGKNVKIFVSGGIDEKDVIELRDLVDGFGIGTSLSDAPVIDFSFKIVEMEGGRRFVGKRGVPSGAKDVFRSYERMEDLVCLRGSPKPDGYEPLLKDLIRDGEIVREERPVDEIRADVLRKLELLSEKRPKLRWM